MTGLMNGALPAAAYVDGDGARYSLRGSYHSRPIRGGNEGDHEGDHEVRLELWRFDLEVVETEAAGAAARCVARIYCIVDVAVSGQGACFCDVWVERAADQPPLGDFLIDRALEVVRTQAGELALTGIAKVDLGPDAGRSHRSYVTIRVPAGAPFGSGVPALQPDSGRRQSPA